MTSLGLVAAASIWASLQAPGQSAGPLTIEQAAQLAERNAFAVRIQASAVEKSRQRIAEAQGALGPRATVNANYTHNGRAQTTQFGAGQPPVVVAPAENQSITGSISLPIDIAGNQHRLVRANEAGYRASQKTLLATLNDARLNARTAFLNVLRNRSLVRVAEQALANATAQLTQARAQFAQVQVAKIDVERLDAQVAQANSNLIAAQNNLELANYGLNLSLARPIETPIDVVDIDALPATPTDVAGLAKNAQVARPEARALLDQIESLANIRRAQESGLDPSLSFTLAQQRSFGSLGFSGQSTASTFTIGLSVPLFDSGVTRARVKQARQDEVQAKIQLEQTQLIISQDVRSAATNLTGASARLTNARRQLALAEEVFRLSQIRQSSGVGTYVEVVDAQLTVTQARNGLVSAKYDYLVAYSQLQRAIGTDTVAGPATAAPGGTQ